MARITGSGRTRPPVQSVARAVGLLQQLAILGRPAGLAELAAASGLERTTAWRLLTTLEACGLVDRDSSSTGFRVGFGAVAVAAAALGDGAALASRVQPELRRLGHDLDRFLAEPLQAMTERTITDGPALRRELARVRASGVAVSDEEFERGCVGFSAAVHDWAGRPATIVGVTGPSFRMRRSRFPFYRHEVLRSAQAAAAALGYGPPSQPPGGVRSRAPQPSSPALRPVR